MPNRYFIFVTLSLSVCLPSLDLSLLSTHLLSLYLRINLYFFKALLLITDGRQTEDSYSDEPSPEMVSTAIKNRGIKIVAIGIADADPFKLSNYASNKDIFMVQDFSLLELIVWETRNALLGPSKLIIIFLYF